ncbi:outer membrane receptor protein involved in Fe transport [Chitinophaga skermanii]|uniref:Outer membrane receptor protein involved in Fe transport n=1 Tax=Chitinophaga skermanii TaxID=331697 RepID=A0A327QCM8_9BACT|nr:TonB-dependent receptor [Chitinophaga skermanii]RAJ01594.1 outer membrane receptor protein involved in Fe transport [Chitinophaga skermanii]
MKKLAISAFLLLLVSIAQSLQAQVTISGIIRDGATKKVLPFVNTGLRKSNDSVLLNGTISGEDGRFTISQVKRGNYVLVVSYLGYTSISKPIVAGTLNQFLDVGNIDLQPNEQQLKEITIAGKQASIASTMDKKTFSIADNVTQAGGSVLDAMKNLPGITTDNGKLLLRGSDKVMVLIDGKQTALTGFGGQSSLENIAASSIEKIEIINNPSAKYDANGHAGIINIIFKKEKKDGFNGKIGIAGGLGAIGIKQENLPGIRPQYQATPKVNPSLSLNYRKNKLNWFFQGDDLYTKTLNKNEFVDRYYDDGTIVKQQTKRNRSTNIATVKTGVDYYLNHQNTFTVSGLFSSEKILDNGDEPFYNADLSKRNRLWQFLEDELKTTATASASWQHTFQQPGRVLNTSFNYTFHREDEKYYFTNILPSYTSLDSFKLLSDEHVADLNVDYVQPLRYGRFETGLKFRRRYIPVNMQFKPGEHTALDVHAGGEANYGETITAAYGNYIFENSKLEVEAGLRVELVNLDYYVNPNHPTYKSDGYSYVQPFPNVRLAYKINDAQKLSFFYNRRVDRPNEVDIRIFPKYDDAEIIKVGNPALRPQFTNTFEMGYKVNWQENFLFVSLYYKNMQATITRISSTVPGSDLIYNIFQNVGKSYNSGVEVMLSKKMNRWFSFNLNLNGYQNIIDSFSVENLYPTPHTFSAAREQIFSGNAKLNLLFKLPKQFEAQLSTIYQAPDLIPQGKIYARFSVDGGIKKTIQSGKGELFANATDIFNTLRTKRTINGNGFHYTSTDYYETQVFRVGYSYKF